MPHMLFECGTELGRQLSFEYMGSKKVGAVFRQNEYGCDIWNLFKKIGAKFADLLKHWTTRITSCELQSTGYRIIT